MCVREREREGSQGMQKWRLSTRKLQLLDGMVKWGDRKQCKKWQIVGWGKLKAARGFGK